MLLPWRQYPWRRLDDWDWLRAPSTEETLKQAITTGLELKTSPIIHTKPPPQPLLVRISSFPIASVIQAGWHLCSILCLSLYSGIVGECNCFASWILIPSRVVDSSAPPLLRACFQSRRRLNNDRNLEGSCNCFGFVIEVARLGTSDITKQPSFQSTCVVARQHFPRSTIATKTLDKMAPSARHPTNLGQIIEYIPGMFFGCLSSVSRRIRGSITCVFVIVGLAQQR